jgi:hypothetical protein
MKHQSFHDYCKEQIGRLAACVNFPDPKDDLERVAVKELIDTLEFRVSKGSRDFAKRVVDTVLENSRFSPAPADLIAIGQQLREGEVSDRRREDGSIVSAMGFPGCQACGFSGWIAVEKNGYDFSEACVCRRKTA